MADEEIVYSLRTQFENANSNLREQGKRDGRLYAEGFSEGASGPRVVAGSGIPTAEQRRAVANVTAGLVGAPPASGAPTALSVAEKRAAVQALSLAERFGQLDDEERKAIAAVRKNIQAIAGEEASILSLQRERDRQAKALARATQKLSRQEEIYEQQGTTKGQIAQLAAERQAYTALASTLSEERRRQLANPNTPLSRRIGLEFGGNSLLQAERGQFQGSPFGNELKKGFFGTRDPGDQLSFGGSIGQVGRFTALYGGAYGLLYQLSNGFSAAAGEAINFTQAVADLNLASGQTAETNRGLADSLGNIAAAAGIAPSQGVSAGAQAIGLFGLAQASASEQAAGAEQSVLVSSRIAAVGGTDLAVTQQNLAGLARSLNISIDRLPALEDELTFISRNIGRPVSELLPAVASVGTLGAGAGFSTQELFAAIGQVTSTTGQSASGAASSFRQVLSRADDPNFGRKVQEQFGIDAQGKSLRDIFAEFSATNPTAEALNRFSLLFGRGASQQVAQILGGNFNRIEGLAAGASGAAGTGLGKSVFDEITESAGFQLKELGAQALNLGKDLSQTGILDLLGLLVKAALVATKALDTVVQTFNLIPAPLRSLVFGLIELQLAIKAFGILRPLAGGLAAGLTTAAGSRLASAAGEGAVAASSARLGAAGGLFRGGLLAPFQRNQIAEAETVTAQGVRAAGAALVTSLNLTTAGLRTTTGLQGLAGLNALRAGTPGIGAVPLGTAAAGGGRLASLGSGALALAGGPVGVALIGATIGIAFVSQIKSDQDEIAQIIAGSRSGTTEAAARGDFAGAAQSQQVAAGQLSQGGGITGYFTAAERDRGVSRANGLAELYGEFDQAVKAEQELARARGDGSAIGDLASLSASDLNAALEGLQSSGETAASTSLLLSKAIEGLINPAEKVIAATQISATATASTTGAIPDILGGLPRPKGPAVVGGSKGGVSGLGAVAAQAKVGSDLTSPEFQERAQANLEGLLKSNGGKALDTGQLDRIAKLQADFYVQESGIKDPTRAQALREGLIKYFSEQIAQAGGAQTPLLSRDQLLAGISAATGLIGQRSGPDGIAELQRALGQIDDLRSKAADPADAQLASVIEARRAVVADLAKATIDDNLRILQALNSLDPVAAARKSQGELKKAVDLATASGNTDLVVSVIEGANRAQIAIVRASLEAVVRAKQAALAALPVIAALGAAAFKDSDVKGSTDASIGKRNSAQDAVAEAQKRLRLFLASLARSVIPDTNKGYGLGSNPSAGAADSPEDIANAQTRARVAGNNSAIVQARASIEIAQRDLAAAKANTVAYYTALAALREGQRQLALAELAYASDQRKLDSDLTDPVAQARNAIKDARAKLAADIKSGQGADVIAADRVAVRQAINQGEAAAFQQRFNDAQTADRLGRISHQAYLRYLNNEHDRLTAITKRTRQQQEQLDQVDSAIQAANEQLQGQFNLGDIKVPSPYEVRRYIAETANAAKQAATGQGTATTAGFASTVSASSVQNQVYINGADPVAVEAILRRLISGSSISTATSSSGRK